MQPAADTATGASPSPSPSPHPQLPVVVVGAGPVGLAAAAHLLERGLRPVVLEKGAHAGAAVAEWGHVRLFSRWSELVDPAARRLLARVGWAEPTPTDHPTGAEWVDRYLRPLADALGDHVRHGSTVTGIARQSRDRVVDSGRDERPFTVHVRDTAGRPDRVAARAVVDASGTWSRPGPLGGDGYPADGEERPEVAARISRRIPDIASPRGSRRHAGRRTAVVGSGHSALTALVALSTLADRVPGTSVVWVLRRGTVDDAYGGGEADGIPARGALGLRARDAVRRGHVEVVTGFRTRGVEHDEAADAGPLTLVADDGRRLEGLDEVVALTGFRPDHSIMAELRLRLDTRLEAPAGLAPLIDPNVHSCGSVPPHGVAELTHDERDVHVVGMKAYGRAPTFLALTGYEQVRSVVAALAGDDEAAARVELTLPETGVCGGAGLFDADDDGAADGDTGVDGAGAAAGGCCGPARPAAVHLGGLSARHTSLESRTTVVSGGTVISG